MLFLPSQGLEEVKESAQSVYKQGLVCGIVS